MCALRGSSQHRSLNLTRELFPPHSQGENSPRPAVRRRRARGSIHTAGPCAAQRSRPEQVEAGDKTRRDTARLVTTGPSVALPLK